VIFKLAYDRAVMETGSLSTAEAMVALAWASTCDYKTGSDVKQSFETVAQKAKMSRRSVIRVTQELVRKGWLDEVERQPYKPTVYRLSIPTTDDISLVTDAPGIVTSERRLVTKGTPTSDTVSRNKKNTRSRDKNKDKSNNQGVASAPVLPDSDHPLLDISPSSADLPLVVPTEAVAPPIEEEEDETGCLDIQFETDEEKPEASEGNPASKETQKESEAGRENSDAPVGHSGVEAEVAKRATRGSGVLAFKPEVVAQCHLEIDAGFTGTWNQLIKDALKKVEW
jgi:hypothetical protein